MMPPAMTSKDLVTYIRRRSHEKGWDCKTRQGQTSHLVATLILPDGSQRMAVIPMGRGQMRKTFIRRILKGAGLL